MSKKVVRLSSGSEASGSSEPVAQTFQLSGVSVIGTENDHANQFKMMRERLEAQGRFAWSKKHRYLGCDPQWHELWVLLIPAFGCSCKQDFADYCKDNPPDFSSPNAYWLWGYNLHNWVNRKLGKTELTIEEALAIWRREDGTKQGEGMG